jgi:hypothetical protein
MVHRPVPSTARHSTSRAPRRSTKGPSTGDTTAASSPPSDTAPAIAVRDQPNASVIGTTNTASTATAGPCRAKPVRQRQASTTQP